MKLRYIYNQEENHIRIKTDVAKDNEIDIEKFRLNILSSCFMFRNIKLITTEPQKYSLGKELEPRDEICVDQSKVIINGINNCNITLLKDISLSEDFTRGFLAIIIIDNDPLESLIREFVKFQKGISNRMNKITSVMAFCGYDADYFYLFNSKLNIENLQALQ